MVRCVLGALPDRDQYTLVDLGRGEGRGRVVGAELGFKEVINLAGNALQFMPPKNRLVLFLDHLFGREGVAHFLAALENKIVGGYSHVFVVYGNPVWGSLLDRSAHLARWSAAPLPSDGNELGLGPDLSDEVVVWQSVPWRYTRLPAPERRLAVSPEPADFVANAAF